MRRDAGSVVCCVHRDAASAHWRRFGYREDSLRGYGGPARRANVFLQAPINPKLGTFPPREVFRATTDPEGSFTIPNVTPGEYYVVARYAGYISADEYVFPGALSPELTGAPGALPAFVQLVAIVTGETRHVEIHLKRGGAISGSVTYSDGAPVPYVGLTPKFRLPNGTTADAFAGGASHTDGSDLMIFAGGGMRLSNARAIFGTGSVDVNVADTDVINVSLTVSPTSEWLRRSRGSPCNSRFVKRSACHDSFASNAPPDEPEQCSGMKVNTDSAMKPKPRAVMRD
jgi:hypothetical protein